MGKHRPDLHRERKDNDSVVPSMRELALQSKRMGLQDVVSKGQAVTGKGRE